MEPTITTLPEDAWVVKEGSATFIIGKGNSLGNDKWRKLIIENQKPYLQLKTYGEKAGLSQIIVNTIRKEGGRFLCWSNPFWREIGDQVAQEVTLKALRQINGLASTEDARVAKPPKGPSDFLVWADAPLAVTLALPNLSNIATASPRQASVATSNNNRSLYPVLVPPNESNAGSHQHAPSASVATSNNSIDPPHWCSVCQLDLQSAKSWEQHTIGSTHRNRVRPFYCESCDQVFDSGAALAEHVNGAEHGDKLETATSKRVPQETLSGIAWKGSGPFPCGVCRMRFQTSRDRVHHWSYDREHIKKMYKRKGLTMDDQVALEVFSGLVSAAVKADVDDRDVDYNKLDDAARMKKRGFNDAVVEVALNSYETFHGMEHGTATYSMVQGSSAGIQGWASSSIDDVPHTESEEAASTVRTPAAWEKVLQEASSKGDAEETRLLKLAMMESMLESRGVCPPCRPDDEVEDEGSYSDESYLYEDGEDDEKDNEENNQVKKHLEKEEESYRDDEACDEPDLNRRHGTEQSSVDISKGQGASSWVAKPKGKEKDYNGDEEQKIAARTCPLCRVVWSIARACCGSSSNHGREQDDTSRCNSESDEDNALLPES